MIDAVFRNVRFLPGTIHAGFPSPASDYEERELDINDLVVPHPTSSYFMRVSGNSMIGACIYHDDIIVIDRAITAAHNRIVVARIGEEFTLKRLRITKNRKIFLKPENPKYTALEVTGRDDFEVWGVVTWVLHRHLRRI
ncbi:MAG TPA: translesion error-prone DNA polymerase V autoproteolytic subunit [Ktedonobacteraceae bacterium]|nr:translesion error-prone DNA polymerase V autoproteolytic subunit [Ktedonobacteraceae bacterium]